MVLTAQHKMMIDSKKHVVAFVLSFMITTIICAMRRRAADTRTYSVGAALPISHPTLSTLDKFGVPP